MIVMRSDQPGSRLAWWGALALGAAIWIAYACWTEWTALAKDPTPSAPGSPSQSSTELTLQELGKLQGSWDVVDYEYIGQKHSLDELQITKMTLRISGNKFTVMVKRPDRGHLLKGTFSIDPSQDPKWMDWTEIQLKRPSEEKLGNRLGIYRLEDDTLRFCAGKIRPLTFATSPKPDLDQRLYKFKRERT